MNVFQTPTTSMSEGAPHSPVRLTEDLAAMTFTDMDPCRAHKCGRHRSRSPKLEGKIGKKGHGHGHRGRNLHGEMAEMLHAGGPHHFGGRRGPFGGRGGRHGPHGFGHGPPHHMHGLHEHGFGHGPFHHGPPHHHMHAMREIGECMLASDPSSAPPSDVLHKMGGKKGMFHHGHHEFGKHGPMEATPAMPTDVLQAADAYTVLVDLPGMAKEDISVTFGVHPRSLLPVLVLQGERKPQVLKAEGAAESEKTTKLREERVFGQLFRRFKLPADAACEAAATTYSNGVLTVTVPRRHMAAIEAQAPLDIKME
eukprot:TRINITY_DN15956_c0_g1_i2.p1 TRINITY_DN15956_c0_g1~~TRINITY_DN15956_c0_g1_i2.p1  ORF type:complete len:310 (+),score=46.20 TRINITY_DN15956_c0_g1_i2:67-996(+)